MSEQIEANVLETRNYENETPKSVITVHLPTVTYTSSVTNEQKQLHAGMHTDMILSLRESLRALKPKFLNGILVEGRFFKDREKYNEFTKHPLYQFYLLAREHLTFSETGDKNLQKVLPLGINITADDVKKYSLMRFNPATLSKELGFDTAWFPAIKILQSSFKFEDGEKSLQSILGGVNEFRIGTNSLPGGILRLVKSKIEDRFIEKQSSVLKTRSSMKEEVIRKVANLIEV